MTPLEKFKAERDELKPRDLHFRPECGDYTCGAHKSWEEGFNAALRSSAVRELVEALDKIGTVDVPSASDKTSWIVMLESVGVLAREQVANFNDILKGLNNGA